MADAFISQHQPEKSQHFPDPEGAAIDGDCLSYKGQFSKKVSDVGSAYSSAQRVRETLVPLSSSGNPPLIVHLWRDGFNIADIAQQIEAPEYKVARVICTYLDKKYDDARRAKP